MKDAGRARRTWSLGPGAVLAILLVACGDGGSARSAHEAPYLRILGTAQDGGLPHAACVGQHCVRAREEPGFRRLIASVAVIDPTVEPTAVYLIDATPDVREQLDRLEDVRGSEPGGVDRAPLDGIFLTHAHIGHYLGLAFFGYEAIHPRSLPVWATPGMASYLRTNGPWSQLVDLGNIDLRATEPGAPVRLSDALSMTAIRVPHRDEYADTVGFVIEGPSRTALYVPDTDRWEAWRPPLAERIAELGVDVALVDATFHSAGELPGRSVEAIGHPLITVSMDMLQERVDLGALEVWFTHLNHSNPAVDPDGEAAREIARRGYGVASDGLEIEL